MPTHREIEARPDLPAYTPKEEQQAFIQNIEDIARNLLRPQSTPEAQKTGAQLLVLTQELWDPTLTPQQQIQLIDEAQKRMNLPVSKTNEKLEQLKRALMSIK